MTFYIDTSVLVAYYCPEALSNRAQAVLQKSEPAISILTEVELYSALLRKVNLKELDRGDAHRISSTFQSHIESGIFKWFFLETYHYQMARDAMIQMQTPLRTLDALHLSLVVAHNLELVTADKNFAKSARMMGLKVRFLSA